MAKDKTKFELNKAGGHSFDISKGNKRHFDLSKDDDEPAGTTAPTPPAEDDVPEQGHRNSKKWLWIPFVVIIALLGWWLLSKSDSSKAKGPDEVVEETTVDKTDDNGTDVDSTSDTGTDTEDRESDVADESVESVIPAEGLESDITAEEPVVSTETPRPGLPAQRSEPGNTTADYQISSDIETEALKVIRGEYGIGQERRNKLGDKYHVIQNRVNELKREGFF